MTDDLTRQIAEIEVLCSIYGDEWKTEDEANREYSMKVGKGEDYVVFYVKLPEDYPSNSPPTFEFLAPNLSVLQRGILRSQLEEVYLEHVGEEVLYQWVEKIRETLEEVITAKDAETNACVTDKHTDIPPKLPPESSTTQYESATEQPVWEVPDIIHGEPITDRKSVFQGHVAHIVSSSQVRQVLEKLYENKRIMNATHNIYAYRIYNETSKTCIQDCEDDGESHAGGRLLHLLQIVDAKNVMVVVTRWYGGILLGPDRFRHINNAARQVLVSAGVIAESKKQKKK